MWLCCRFARGSRNPWCCWYPWPGAAGASGAVGPPGLPGLQGIQGPKGDAGSGGKDGTPGLKGDKGNVGEAGQPGPAGSVGSKGIKGSQGAIGQDGMKGEPGAPYIPATTSAFSVQRNARFEVTSSYKTITYDGVVVNVGDDFDPLTGIFTCRIPGLYFFSFNFWHATNERVDIRLMQNGLNKVRLYSYSGTSVYSVESQSIILPLVERDEIWLNAHSPTDIMVATLGENTFVGYLIQADTLDGE